MTTAIANRRQGHPYWMFDTLRTQPAVLGDLLGGGWDQARTAAALLKDRQRLFLVGIGSSLHVAQAGEQWLRRLVGVDAWAVASLEFSLEGPALREGDAVIVISHRGGGGYTRDALVRAQAAGVPVITLTGRESAMPAADVSLKASAQEVCQCHTVGYASALLVILQVATALADVRGCPLPTDWQAQLQQIPAIMTAQAEGDMSGLQAWAADLVQAGTVVAIGGGLHQATADEVALKIQEAVHKPVLSLSVEQLAHGPLAALSQGDVVLSVLPPAAPALPRQEQLVAGLAEIGIPVWGLGTGSRQLPAAGGAEILAPLTTLVPWQLLTYWYAVAAGVDPDWNRLDEPAHAAAKSHY
jgi:glucosamine--fructose-6-phosphate aminotransferase (isomerizing)